MIQVMSNKWRLMFGDVTPCNYLLFFIELSTDMHPLPLFLTSEALFPYKPGSCCQLTCARLTACRCRSYPPNSF